MERQIGDISDYESWSDSGCEKLALAVAAAKGRQYALLYAHWRKAKSEDKKKYYRACLNSIELFFEKSFIGAFVDSEAVLDSIRYKIDKDMGILK